MSSVHEDEEDNERMEVHLAVVQFLVLFASALYMLPDNRNRSVIEQRLLWNEYSARHEQRGTLTRRLRMSQVSFNKLVLLLAEDLLVDGEAARKQGGAIIPEICLYCTLRYLAGGSYLDISDIAGILQSSFYRIVWKTITAIVKCSALQITFPKTDEELQAAIAGFCQC